jgi:hypothetical protein
VITRGIREFMSRDWHAVRERKDRHWADRIEALGAPEGLRIADELRRHVVGLQSGWPSDADRQADLDTHVRVSRLLRRADCLGRFAAH